MSDMAGTSGLTGRVSALRARMAAIGHDLGGKTGLHASSGMPYAVTRRRLVWINLLVVSGILLAMAVAVYAWEVHVSDQQVNEQLIHWASRGSLTEIISPTHDGASGSAGESAEQHDSESYEPSSPNVFSVAINSNGKVIFDPGNVAALGLPDLAAAQPVLSGKESSTLVTVGQHDSLYRLYTVPIEDHGTVVGALQTGTSLAARDRTLHDLLLTLVGVIVVSLLLTAGASLYLAERALVPMLAAFERQRKFAAAASHELRTPLAIVRSQAELVERSLQRVAQTVRHATPEQAASLDRTHEDVGEIMDEVDYMTRLVRDLLVLARDEEDMRGLSWSSVDVRALASDVVAKLQSQAKAHSLTLQLGGVARDALPAFVRGDSDRLRQLALILLENAIRYTPEGGTITMSVRVMSGRRVLRGHGGSVQMIVSDTGQGIEPDDLPHIFEPFYRAHPERAEADGHSGAGLGLALARWIVAAHGGEITVTSTLGKGTTFVVSLPYLHEA